MTIDDQLRILAHRIDQHQPAITADEVIQRTDRRRTGPFITNSRFTDRSRPLGDLAIPFNEEEATLIDLDSEPQAPTSRKRSTSLAVAGLLAAAAVVAVAVVARDSNNSEIPADQPTVPAFGSVPAGDAPIEPGAYRIPSSAWSVADFTVTFPEGWNVQYGHNYSRNTYENDEAGFHAVVVDEIWADSCAGSNGNVTEVGPTVEDLTAALLEQPGPAKGAPIDTILGGYPATRIDLTVPEGFDLEPCNAAGVGLQIWHSEPADENFVLLADGIASVYIVDVNGERQVFVTQHDATTSDTDVAEVQSVLDSIRIEPAARTAETSVDDSTSNGSVPLVGSIPTGDGSIEPGTHRIASSSWSVADFLVTLPEFWTVQYGHVYASRTDRDEEFGFYAVTVDEIYADPCVGSDSGEVIEFGPSVDDLVTALLEQRGPVKGHPVDTTLGGYPATRIDLTVPEAFDLEPCNVEGLGLQIWYSAPADMYFVLLDGAIASVYILDVEGERQVFVTQRSATSSTEDQAELQTVLDSISIVP